MQTQFDDFDAQLQCEDVQAEYIPTDQDLLDMEVAFRLSDSEIIEVLESMSRPLSTFRSFSAICDFDLDEVF